MSTTLLATKLYIPPLRSAFVQRPRLVHKLNAGLKGKLTLISAPAGFGKTTLLSACAQKCDKPIAWLSLDQGDNDPKRFLNYLIAAIQQVNPEIGRGIQVSLQSTQNLEIEFYLTSLINEISEQGDPFAVVLDDYHLITEPKIQDRLIYFVENLPISMHLIISSRSDPPWPLARFRVRGELTEIRSQDMRFTEEEAAEFLNNAMGLTLSPADIAVLESRTEGWIAGLQMAAISMSGRDDISGFIQSFTGSHRFVIDYLMEEVLEQQTPDIQEFLLKTSVLERLNSELCNVIFNRDNSQSVLNELEQKNLFLIPLDDERRWYRYHHLFSDLLRNHFRQTHPDEVVRLHKKASVWYERNNLLSDAIEHALAANDIKQIIHLTKELALDTLDYRESRVLMSWLEHLSDADFQQYPWLLVTRASVNFRAGKFELTEQDFEAAEKILSMQLDTDETSIRIRGHIAASRSYLAELREDTLTALQEAETALALLPEKDVKLRSYVSIRWANCLAWIGDYQKAVSAYKEAGKASKLVGDGQSAIIALSEMALVQMLAGNLQQAVKNIHEICNYAEELAYRDGRRLPAMGILYRHMSHIKREQNKLSEANYYANEGVKICQLWGEKEALIFGYLALAKVKFAEGDYDQVDNLFRQILEIADEISLMAVEQFQTSAIHFQLLQGKIQGAEIWARDLGLTPNDKFGYVRRFEYQNYAHLLTAQGNYIQALKIVNGLVKIADDVGDGFYIIHFLTLQAIILYKMNRRIEAMTAIGAALSLARSEGYVRAILDEGEDIRVLLQMTIAQGSEVAYANKLLSSLGDEKKSLVSGKISATGLVDPLSQRETEVLRLLVTDLPAPEIAAELVVSVSTVRSHIKHIYSKMDVHSRYEAVSKAKELGIL